MVHYTANYPAVVQAQEYHTAVHADHTVDLSDVDCGPGTTVPKWEELLATYSYALNAEDVLKVVIPGVPSVYAPPPGYPLTLRQDEVGLVDANGFRVPFGPMEPCVKAINELKRNDFDLSHIDVVLDRNIIRNLSKFCQDHSRKLEIESASGRCIGTVDKWYPDRGFGFVQIVSCEHQPALVGQRVYCHISELYGKTTRNYQLAGPLSFGVEEAERGPRATNVVELSKPGNYFNFGMIRCSNGTAIIRRMEKDNLGESAGYGKAFEKLVDGSTNRSIMGFWEINLFDIGGMKAAVRCEVDGVIPKSADSIDPNWTRDSGRCESDRDRRMINSYDNVEGLRSSDMVINQEGRDHMISIQQGFDSFELKCLSTFPRHLRQTTDYVNQMRLGNAKMLVMANHKRGTIERGPTIYSVEDFVQAANIPDDHREPYDYVVHVIKSLIATCKDNVPYRVEFDLQSGIASLYEDESARPISVNTSQSR